MSGSLIPFRCRRGWHSFREAGTRGNLLSGDRRTRHTYITVETCHRCGKEQHTEHFHSYAYWREVEREREDSRLEEVIRRATR